MKIESVRIKNFRSFEDETIHFDSHTCLLGPNGAGKSNVLQALNVFFQEASSNTNVSTLSAKDFHNENTTEPVEICVTFCELSDRARKDIKHYVYQNKIIVIAKAEFDSDNGEASVKQHGKRLIYKKFAPFFEAEKKGAKHGGGISELRDIFKQVTAGIEQFAESDPKMLKGAMQQALWDYEEKHPEKCVEEPSEDLFYGFIGKGKLNPFIQWVYIPAVKEASKEAEEANNTALGKLLQRTVRKNINFDDRIRELNQEIDEKYGQILSMEQGALKDISVRLSKRIEEFSHSQASLEVVWDQGSKAFNIVQGPKATIQAKEGKFQADLIRFGHGLQRSFLLAILQELALSDSKPENDEEYENSTLILACEEPELYQHPPQARHLAYVLRGLSGETGDDCQVLLTTHSPYFVSGEAFEEIRLVRKDGASGKSDVQHTNFDQFSGRITEITGRRLNKPEATRAKLSTMLQPEKSEMFLCNKLVLVEGIEDRAYITTALLLEDRWGEVHRAGLHIVPANRKSAILDMLIAAQNFRIPTYVVFDADGDEHNEERRNKHKQDNEHLMKALNIDDSPFPNEVLQGNTYTIWPSKIGKQIKEGVGDSKWESLKSEAKKSFDSEARGLSKNPLLIAKTLELAWKEGHKPPSLVELVQKLVEFASN